MNMIDLVYFDGCPSWQTALVNIRQAVEAENIPYQLRLIEVTTPEQAQDECFLGSPSFRLNGVDMWPETRKHYNLSCRVYLTSEGMSGSPTVEMLRGKIRELLKP
jgi:hypothetical protein